MKPEICLFFLVKLKLENLTGFLNVSLARYDLTRTTFVIVITQCQKVTYGVCEIDNKCFFSKELLTNPPMDPLYAKKVYLSVEDFTQMVQLAIEAPNDLNFGVFNALSDNREKLLDISKAKSILGYKPLHDAFSILEA